MSRPASRPSAATSEPPIMLRADLSRSEWERFRVACIRRNTTPREVTTYLLRDYANLHEPEPATPTKGA